MAADPWPVIHEERAVLASDLATLDDSQWQTQSLCPGWSVRDVLGHMIATAKLSPAKFFASLAGSGFRFHQLSEKNIRRETAGTPAQTLAEFRRMGPSTGHPPGPADSMLGETILHSEDIRRPLGITREYPQASVIQVTDFFKGSNMLIGSKNRIAGLTLRATDADWRTGSGPEVSGPLLSLLLAMTGREAVLDDLAGDGLPQLRSRHSGAAA